jgi:hypothetical protein
MVERLRSALVASEAFDFPDPVKVDSLEYEHFVSTKSSFHLKALESRLIKSQSPMLVILQNLYQESKVANNIDQYLGAWSPSLRVVIADKPEEFYVPPDNEDDGFFDGYSSSGGGGGKSSEVDDDSSMGQRSRSSSKGSGGDHANNSEKDNGGSTAFRTEEREHQERIKELESAMSSGNPSAWRDSLSFFKRSQKPTASIMLKSMLRGTDVVDPVVEHRVALNLKREGLVQQLFELRERQAHFDTDMVKCQMLRSFLNNEVSDPNRVLIDFWLARMELAHVTFPEEDHKDHEVVDQETGEVHLDESAASHLFGKLQQYTRDRRNLVGDFRGQALNAREVFKNELKAAEQFREELKVKAEHDFTAQRVHAREKAMKMIESLTKRPGEDGTEATEFALPSHPSLQLPWEAKKQVIDERIRRSEDSLHTLSAHLSHRRREFRHQVNKFIEEDSQQEIMPTQQAALGKRAADQADSAALHKRNVAEIKEAFKNGFSSFYGKLAEKMASGAQASLEAIDRKFTDADIYNMDRSESMFDDLLWEVEEKRWRVETAENNRRTMCAKLSDDLEGRIKQQNKALFQVELDRVERLQQLKDKKMERRATGKKSVTM